MSQPTPSPREPAGGGWRSRLWDSSGESLTVWTHLSLLIGAAALLTYYWTSAKIPLNDGFGWDGVQYARWVSHLDEDLAAHNVNRYYIMRVLPSFVVSIPARILGLPITRDYIVFGFAILNSICAYLVAVYWLRSCLFLRLTGSSALLGLALLVFNFPVTKMSAYDGVLTDLPAFAMAALILDCWVRSRLIALTAAVVASMFCWPSAAFVGSLLILLPRGAILDLGRLSWVGVWTARGATFTFAIACLVKAKSVLLGMEPVSPIMWALLPTAVVVAGAYVLVVSRLVTNQIKGGNGRPRLSGASLRCFACWLLVIPGVTIAQGIMAPDSFGGAVTPDKVAHYSIRLPGIFLVADFAYYGALAILAALFLPRLLREAAQLGTGLLCAIALALAINLTSESRFIINTIPLLALPLVMSMRQTRLSSPQWTLVIALQVLTSKVWLPIGATSDDFAWENLQDCPAQYLFSSLGPWMADRAYLLQGATAVASYLVAQHLFERTSRPRLSDDPQGTPHNT